MGHGVDESGRNKVELSKTTRFALGRLVVCPADLLVEDGAEKREIQPRVMQVLVALAESRSTVVSRDELIERCWGGVIVGDDSINRCILTLRNLAKSSDPPPFVIETVPRIGYRLVERDQLLPPASELIGNRSRLWVFGIGLGLCLAVALIALWRWQQPALVMPSTIAITPFRTLSRGTPYFAEGLSEEILDQLAQDPGLRLAGRNSAARIGAAADLQAMGRELGIDYILEGSVRAEPGRVLVDASLVRTSDGVMLWSQRYDSKPGDIFAMQQSIGEAVASALNHKLAVSPLIDAGIATNGKAYRDYLTATGMLRTRNPKLGSGAADLLRQTVAAAPGFAPAWARLAEAIRSSAALAGPEQIVASLPEAISDARRAVALAPDLAEANGILGMLLGYQSAKAQALLRRGAELAPNDAEAQLWRASADAVSGNFEQEMLDYRRAQALDSEWFRPSRDLMIANAEMGNRAAAEAIADRTDPADSISQNMFHARIAWLFGDLAQATKRWSTVAAIDSLWQAPAKVALSNARFTLALRNASPPLARAHSAELRGNVGRVWLPGAPAEANWRNKNRNSFAAVVYAEDNVVAAKMMLNARRGQELLWGYDLPVGLLSVHRDQPLDAWQLRTVPLVALALRQGGRAGEAEKLIRQADALVTAITRRGKVPFSFEVTAAGVKAANGDSAGSLSLLEQAERRGWSHTDVVDLLRLQSEPAFASLHGQARFTALVDRLDRRLIIREHDLALRLGL